MKLRILDSSIRFRLTQSEVDAVNSDGLVTSTVRFTGGKTFEYVLQSCRIAQMPQADISTNQLVVRVPRSTILSWVSSDQVSIRSTQVVDDGAELKILVEKDFQCLSPREDEDESDMYPHPATGEDSC